MLTAKPSKRPPGTPVIHSGHRVDDPCADDCAAADDDHIDECIVLCDEER